MSYCCISFWFCVVSILNTFNNLIFSITLFTPYKYLLPPSSAGEVIESELSFCVSVCVGLWELHCAPPSEHRILFMMLCTIDLCCEPPTCVVHHRHTGDLCPWEVGVAPDIFHFLIGHKEHAEKRTLFVRIIPIIFLWLRKNMQIKVHNVVLYRHTLQRECVP